MSKQSIGLLVLDLDNTLYDWVSAFVPALYASVEIASSILDASQEQILDDLKVVHELHGDTEHPFALLETRTAGVQYAGKSLSEIRAALAPALQTFDSVMAHELRLYPGVSETLSRIRTTGVPIVAYTDARIASSLSRVEKLGLTASIARLYAPAPRYNSSMIDGPLVTLLRPEDRKPNPQVLADICRKYGILPPHAAYVGDSLTRDVFMAKEANVVAVWAEYGTRFNKEHWPKLVRVSHWTQVEVESDARLREKASGVAPDRVLSDFEDLLGHFEFKPDV